jgi:hypothetical protein
MGAATAKHRAVAHQWLLLLPFVQMTIVWAGCSCKTRQELCASKSPPQQQQQQQQEQRSS